MNFLSNLFKGNSNKPNQPQKAEIPLVYPISPMNTQEDYSSLTFYAEGFKTSSIVRALCELRMVTLAMAPLTLWDMSNPKVPLAREQMEDIPLYQLLTNPMEQMDEFDLIKILEEFRIIGGAGYLFPGRGPMGTITSLVPYTPQFITPISSDRAGLDYKMLDHYRLKNNLGDEIDNIPPAALMCFRWGAYDPQNYFRPTGPLLAVAREIEADNARINLQIAISKMGIAPNYIATPGPEQELDEASMRSISEMLQTRFGSKNQGRALLLQSPGAKVTQMRNDLGALNSNELAVLPETRISQELGIPLQILSFMTSSNAKTYQNFPQAIKQYFKNMENEWKYYSRVFTRFFNRPENVLESNKKYIVGFDLSNIPELHDGVDLQRDRALVQFIKGGITQNEYRDVCGLPPAPNGDKFIFELAPSSLPGNGPTSLPVEQV